MRIRPFNLYCTFLMLLAPWPVGAQAQFPGTLNQDDMVGVQEHVVTVKTGEEINFNIRLTHGNLDVEAFEILSVERNGKEISVPASMKLNSLSGVFTWKPTPSQAGRYAIAFGSEGQTSDTAPLFTRLFRIEARTVTTLQTDAGVQLRHWYANGTAAGNTGDFYDNRDDGHSLLNPKLFPQLDRVRYSEEQREKRLHFGAQTRLLHEHVTVGNSSTGTAVRSWGSHPRRICFSPDELAMVVKQYYGNHLYVYPEHRDHDPGRNGRGGGYGDMFPANTPYWITSQGSSGSDLPFLEAVVCTLAAFQPAVKRQLVNESILMPTVQMLFRHGFDYIDSPRDYLTGRAHPSAFRKEHLDVERMVRMAHALEKDVIPPVARLKVVKEDEPRVGIHYFEARHAEKLLTTPAAIARVARSTHLVRTMVVSAEDSYDINGHDLTYRWRILRGDPDLVQIRPRNDSASVVEIRVIYPRRRPVRQGSPLESNRVDVGAFVHNGTYYSAPAFITYCSVASECRTYDPHGRIVEVAYGQGDTTIGFYNPNVRPRDKAYDICDWQLLLQQGQKDTLAGRLFQSRFNEEAWEELQTANQELSACLYLQDKAQAQYDDMKEKTTRLDEDLKSAEAQRGKLNSGRQEKASYPRQLESRKAKFDVDYLKDRWKDAQAELRRVKNELRQSRRASHAVLVRTRDAFKGQSVREKVESALNSLMREPLLYTERQRQLQHIMRRQHGASLPPSFDEIRSQLVREGLLTPDASGRLQLTPRLAGETPASKRLTNYERKCLERLHRTILEVALFPGALSLGYEPLYVDPRLATPKTWRDIYHYENDVLVGWTRLHSDGSEEEYAANGTRVIKKDRLGRPLITQGLNYVKQHDGEGHARLAIVPKEHYFSFSYNSEESWDGVVREIDATEARLQSGDHALSKKNRGEAR